jgi:hypothetical protein
MTTTTGLDAHVSRLADELLFTSPGCDELEVLEEQGARAERMARFAAAMQVQARVAQFHAHQALGQAQWAAGSIAVVEDCSQRAAESRLGWSITLHDHLPVTWSLLREGHLPVASAITVAEQAAVLSPAECARLEQRLWPDGEDTVPTATGRLPRALAQRCQRWIPVIHGADTTHLSVAAARTERDVWLSPGEPGTDLVLLTAPLTVPDSEALMAELNAIADTASPTDPRSRGMLRADALVEKVTGQPSFALWADQHETDTASPTDPRSRGMLRADALVEKVTGQPSFALWADGGCTTPLPHADRWNLSITVPLDVILAGGTDPGLIGRNVVTSPTAKAIATAAITAGGRIHRLVTDPLSGLLLDVTTLRQQRPSPAASPDVPPEDPPPSPPDDGPPDNRPPGPGGPGSGPPPQPGQPPSAAPTDRACPTSSSVTWISPARIAAAAPSVSPRHPPPPPPRSPRTPGAFPFSLSPDYAAFRASLSNASSYSSGVR